MKILVTGADGQIGRELRTISSEFPEFNFTFLNRSGLDILNQAQIDLLFDTLKPNICINCAAYTAVDSAELDTELCFAVNADGPAFLANACQRTESILFHLSTDYVYNHDTNVPLEETHPVSPQGVYAISKLKGELKAMAHCRQTIILRTSWVYSSYGHNFVKTMLKLGAEKKSLNIVSDQMGTPTYARDIAYTVLHLVSRIEESQFGIYNFSNSGYTNWADFARTIFKRKQIDCKVNNMTTAEYNAAAYRPLWSVLSKEKIISDFGINPRPWEDGLYECLELLD